MMHLIKYEWKKTLFLKLFLLAVVLIGEAIFLYCASPETLIRSL